MHVLYICTYVCVYVRVYNVPFMSVDRSFVCTHAVRHAESKSELAYQQAQQAQQAQQVAPPALRSDVVRAYV